MQLYHPGTPLKLLSVPSITKHELKEGSRLTLSLLKSRKSSAGSVPNSSFIFVILAPVDSDVTEQPRVASSTNYMYLSKSVPASDTKQCLVSEAPGDAMEPIITPKVALWLRGRLFKWRFDSANFSLLSLPFSLFFSPPVLASTGRFFLGRN